MSIHPDEKTITIKMNDNFISRVDSLSKKAKISRHQLLKNVIEIGIEELESYENIGLFKLGVLVRDVVEWCKLPKSDPVTGERAIPVTLEEKLIERLDNLAQRADLSRAQLMRNLTRVGIEGLETMEKIGIIKLFTIIRDLPDYFRSVCKDGERAMKSLQK